MGLALVNQEGDGTFQIWTKTTNFHQYEHA